MFFKNAVAVIFMFVFPDTRSVDAIVYVMQVDNIELHSALKRQIHPSDEGKASTGLLLTNLV